MNTTSQKVALLIALAALALAACGGEGVTDVGGETSTGTSAGGGTATGGGMDGAGGSGGQGGAMEIIVADLVECEGTTPAVIVKGTADYKYDPAEVTLKVGDVLRFEPLGSISNMESGIHPLDDGKFHTDKGNTSCLKFHVAGTYPFFCKWVFEPKVTGTVVVQ